jgi:hypothetical protein
VVRGGVAACLSSNDSGSQNEETEIDDYEERNMGVDDTAMSVERTEERGRSTGKTAAAAVAGEERSAIAAGDGYIDLTDM